MFTRIKSADNSGSEEAPWNETMGICFLCPLVVFVEIQNVKNRRPAAGAGFAFFRIIGIYTKILGGKKARENPLLMSNILTVTAENQKAIASCRCARESCHVFHGPQHHPRTETQENICIMTMVNWTLRRITGHVVRDKTSRTIQQMVDTVSEAERYCTDGYFGYCVSRKAHLQHPQQKQHLHVGRCQRWLAPLYLYAGTATQMFSLKIGESPSGSCRFRAGLPLAFKNAAIAPGTQVPLFLFPSMTSL